MLSILKFLLNQGRLKPNNQTQTSELTARAAPFNNENEPFWEESVHNFRTDYFGIDLSSWTVLIKSEILFTTTALASAQNFKDTLISTRRFWCFSEDVKNLLCVHSTINAKKEIERKLILYI